MEYDSLLRLINNLRVSESVDSDEVCRVEQYIESAYIKEDITHKQFNYLCVLLEENVCVIGG